MRTSFRPVPFSLGCIVEWGCCFLAARFGALAKDCWACVLRTAGSCVPSFLSHLARKECIVPAQSAGCRPVFRLSFVRRTLRGPMLALEPPMKNDADHVELPFCCMLGFMHAVPASVRVSFLPSPRQTIEFPDDELVEPLEGLDIAEDGIELPPPPAPEADAELAPAKPNLLVSGRLMRRGSSIFREPEDSQNKIEGSYVAYHCRSRCASCWRSIQHRRKNHEECLVSLHSRPCPVCVLRRARQVGCCGGCRRRHLHPNVVARQTVV